MQQYPKRLIEVDLPIQRISAHARREKSIRHGHISTLHIWWARRPLAACRAVICAALWPDPADPLCPQAFRDKAVKVITEFANKVANTGRLMDTCSKDSFSRWETLSKEKGKLDAKDSSHLNILRFALLDFIADFANWDNSTVPEYLETARALTQAAHEALGGEKGTRPLVVDPFAGGGSIPLEALRVGADAFASDLNPVAVLLNKVVLEYIPKYGQQLGDKVRKWGKSIKEEAEKELADLFPKDPDGSIPVVYLWARAVKCEGPGCGAEVPLLRSLWLARKDKRSVALRLVPRPKLKRVDLEIVEQVKAKDVQPGTIQRGSVTCPCCSYTTPLLSVKRQLKEQHGGANNARLLCVITSHADGAHYTYRLGCDRDNKAVAKALARKNQNEKCLPSESTESYHSFVNRGPLYGMVSWKDYYTARQGVALSTIGRVIASTAKQNGNKEDELSGAVETCLYFALDKCIDYMNVCTRWMPRGTVGNLFARQAIPMTWDFPEANPISSFHCAWLNTFEWVAAVCDDIASMKAQPGHAEQASATAHPLPDDSSNAMITDPPYYYSVQYADLSDFFYVWLRRHLSHRCPGLFSDPVTAKDDEIIVQSPSHEFSSDGKNNAFYEARMKMAMGEARRVLAPSGIGVVVFAHTSTAGWEAQLQAMVDAGWVITGSWPIDTERAARVLALNRSVLASSVHLICRPRESPDGVVLTDVGDWRDVLTELPIRIHEWMPRLATEGVVGADAIFACLGPALEIFSRYSKVEKADGTAIPLKDYLEHVWAAVAKEALSMIFAGADATGFEPDARLTAMWLWTLSTGTGGNGSTDDDEAEEEGDEEEGGGKATKNTGLVLEYDAARKIAQGLGAHLEQLQGVVEVKGDKATLLSVSTRARHLFGKEDGKAPAKKGKKGKQRGLFDEDHADGEGAGLGELNVPEQGQTTLDRIHQSMLLFAAGRGDALKRFIVEEGVGQDQRFWRLAQALSALYPAGTEEKRWVDGVLARKKGLGF
jgi:adenine-specific DNA methylase